MLARLLVALAAVVAVGCGGPDYTAKFAFSPHIPVPHKSTAVQVDIDDDGELLKGAKVVVRAIGPGDLEIQPLALEEAFAGRYVADTLRFIRTGTWTLHADIEFDGNTETHTKKLNVTCKGGGVLGEPCCTAAHCDSGLVCTFASCSSGLNAAGLGCYGGKECASGRCVKGVCQAAACDDGLHNGDETDVDCGGGCDTCPRGKGCKTKADCASGFCTDGMCTHELGTLLGPGGGKDAVKWTVITSKDLNQPTDLAFSTAEEGKIWVTNLGTDAYTVITNPGQSDQTQNHLKDSSAHFSEKNMGIDFTDAGVFGTCGDTRNGYDGKKKTNDFMGPVMWPGKEARYTSGSVSNEHYDMLHQTPNCMGIAGGGVHTFYCFNGLAGTLDWYDFKVPHEPGGTDHTDGHKRRYVEVKLTRVSGVPSNIAVDHATGVVYIADSGGGRVLKVDVSKAVEGASISKWSNDGVMYAMSGAKVTVLADAQSSPVQTPSGLAFVDGAIYVADHATGKLHCIRAKDGKVLRSLDTGLGKGALGGLVASPSNPLRLYFTDMVGNRVVRIDP